MAIVAVAPCLLLHRTSPLTRRLPTPAPNSFSVKQQCKGRRLPSLQFRNGLRVRCEAAESEEKIPFGHTRKDVLLIGLGLTVFGFGLKYGLEAFGVNSLKAGNAVQLIMVLGLTVGWISTYIARVANKDMSYVKQLKEYETKVMEKRYAELPEAELETLLAQVEEDKERLRKRREKKQQSS